MLLANYSQINRLTNSNRAGFTNPHAWLKPTVIHRYYQGEHSVAGETGKSAFNNGYAGQYAWHQAPKAGGIGSVNNLRGVGELTGSAAGGINIEAALDGSGDLSASLSSVISMIATLAGSGDISAAALVGTIQMAADLAGAGDMAGALSLLAGITADLSGSGSVSSALRGDLYMDCDITPYTELSPESLAASVWNAVAATYNNAGTMGEKLNDAGSGSNPWTEVIESGMTAAELLRVISAVLAGKVSGAGTGTETFKGVDGSTDRVVSTVDPSGNRTGVTLDGA